MVLKRETLKRKDSISRRSDGTGGFPSPGPSSIFLEVFSPKEKLIETNSRNVSAFKIAGTAAFSVFAGLSSCFSSFWSSMGEQVFVPSELRVGVCPPSPRGGKEKLQSLSWFR